MLNLTFIPQNKSFVGAAKSYIELWTNEGNTITKAIEQAVGLNFKEIEVEAIVFEGISQSNPLKLRASYNENSKKATLVHELLHRISAEYKLKLPIKGEDLTLGLHKQIDLILYDLWCDLYGRKFANEQVKIESARISLYKAAWDWALSFDRAQRQAKFSDLRH